MKYPQLVSTRAVNAISDWLVSRLEQLGVEAPQIYTRLLLSLLQSAVQVNDPIEFNNSETLIGTRKGNHKRYQPTDTDTLKKLNAIQCLREIVSSDEEVSTIENLVDELFEKLKDIENKSADTENEVNPFLNTNHTSRQSLQNQHQGINIKAKDTTIGVSDKSGSPDTETDPKRRYFRAFPALSKEMENSFSVWRQNSKSLTWPVDRSNVSNSSSSTSSAVSTSFGSKSEAKANLLIAEKNKTEGLKDCDGSNLTTAGGNIKRKSRRRRNQAVFVKGKTTQNIRKNSYGHSAVSGTGNHHRNSSLPYWDTDFEGCWEMGRDLIKEFIVKQNKSNRNRSTSESAAHNIRKDVIELPQSTNMDDKIEMNLSGENKSEKVSPLPPLVDISFCDEDYDDALSAMPEMITDSIGAAVPRRLYERDVHLGSQESFPSKPANVDQSDFAQYTAKFNSSIEALWKNDDQCVTSTEVGLDKFSLGSGERQMPSLPVVAPFREDLKNFWTNYYNNHFDARKNNDDNLHDGASKMEDSSTSLSYSGSGSALNNDFINTSDYYSMPSNMDDFERSVGGARRERTTPISMFLQNSIWSDSCNVGTGGDTDESFYYKVWNSTKKLNQLGVANKDKISNYGDAKAYESGTQFQMYNISKWSEGINAEHSTQCLRVPIGNGIRPDVACVDSSPVSNTTSVANVYNWQMPNFGHNLHADLQSWSRSNPMSLTEMYGGERKLEGLSCNDNELERKPSVTLPNHSKESSGFIAYSRVKSLFKPNVVDNVKQRHTPQQNNNSAELNFIADDENLLTSERTHFYPIKTFTDGHTFDICGSLDVVEYERSPSGYMCLETDRYLEYTRIDNFMAEEDSASTGSRASTAPLYASSNCEAANIDGKIKIKNDFIIRFRIRNTDVGCQTEERTEMDEKPLNSIFGDIARDVKIQASRSIPNHKAKYSNSAIPSSVVADCTTGDHWVAIESLGNGGYRKSSLWTMAKMPDAVYSDDIDYDNNSAEEESSCAGSAFEQQWSMREIGKKCSMKGHGKSSDSDADVHDDNTHTLWGMCAACNNELKSVPANRLLRDELQLEADEIMSDLKYMQDLYIGRSATAADDSEDETNEYEANKEIIATKAEHHSPTENEKMLLDDGKVNDKRLQQVQTTDVLQRMNRLIADLLRPENATKKIVCETTRTIAGEKYLPEDLCDENNEKNIWHPNNTQTTCLQPMQLANALQVENDKFLTQLSWEHDNLAKIWQTGIPSKLETNSPTPRICPMDSEKENNADMETTVAYENLKNQQTFARDTECEVVDSTTRLSNGRFKSLKTQCEAPTTTYVATAAYKRVQHLLNSNISTNATSKLKLTNRKRRHSASQNLFHVPPTIAAPINNNNVDITDLNKFNIKFLVPNTTPIINNDESSNNDIVMDTFINSSLRNAIVEKECSDGCSGIAPYDTYSEELIEPKHTIITCKYWTTIEPMHENIAVDGATLSCLIDKNASILKHVTMVTRPLTR